MQNSKCRIQNEELKIIFVFLFNGRSEALSRYIYDRHFIVVIFYTQNLAVLYKMKIRNRMSTLLYIYNSRYGAMYAIYSRRGLPVRLFILWAAKACV